MVGEDDNIHLDIIKGRANHNRPLDSYPDLTVFVHEKAAQVDGFQLYRSPTSEQTWLIHRGDLKKRGFVAPGVDSIKERMLYAAKAELI